MTIELSRRPSFLRALGCYGRGEWFEAHEHWEDLWRVLPDGSERLFVQGLIQVAAAMHKRFLMKSAAGAVRLLEKAREKIAPMDDLALGLDVARLRRDLETALFALNRELEGGEAFEAREAPRITSPS